MKNKLAYLWNRFQYLMLTFPSAGVALLALAFAGAISWANLVIVGLFAWLLLSAIAYLINWLESHRI